jgi:hypothetical protein
VYTTQVLCGRQALFLKKKSLLRIIKFNKRVIIYTQKFLIVATALPVLNTRPAKSPLFPLLGGGTKAEVYSKALSKIRCYPLLQTRGYVTGSNNIDISNNKSTNLNDSTLNINDGINNINSRGQISLEEGVPSLDDLFKFKEEIKKIREEEFEKWLPNIENISSNLHESFPDLYPVPDETEPGANVVSLFEIIKKIYKKLMNNDIQINESNINTLSNLIKNDKDSDNLSEEIKTTLENITANFNESLSSSGMRPLGNFGDITLNQLFEKTQNFNISMVLNNTELLVYPIAFVPFSLLYYKLVKSYMKHCDNIQDIRRIKNERLMLEQLRIRRVSIAFAVGFFIPLSSLMILKFSRISIFEGFNFKIRNDNIDPMPPSGDACSLPAPLHAKGGPLSEAVHKPSGSESDVAATKSQISTLFFFNKGALRPKQLTPPQSKGLRKQGCLGREQSSLFKKKEVNNKKTNNLNRKYNNKFKIIIVIILLIATATLFFYFNKLSWLFNTITLNIFIFLYFVSFLLSLFFYLFGFFILKFKGNINIDLSFIRINYIRSLIESFIIIKNSQDKIAIDILQKTINRHLIMYMLLLILIFVLFVFR